MENSPCYYCTDRTEECHSMCEKYLLWVDNRQKIMESFNKENIINSYMAGRTQDCNEFRHSYHNGKFEPKWHKSYRQSLLRKKRV